jgi:4-hydroxybutyryl-CoA dehydratase/vinylacetyl-CoA-Delta-isomerase
VKGFFNKILRLIENMSGGTALVESMHGAGSPQTQIEIFSDPPPKGK